MAFADLPVFSILKKRMQYHQARQTVLAQNVANANSPGYKARDIDAPNFASMVKAENGRMNGPAATNAGHFRGFGDSPSAGKPREVDSFETTPSGNSVSLEDEMMKVAQNQLDYQLATTLYTRGVGLLKTALGRG